MNWRWKAARFLVHIAARILGWQEWNFEQIREQQQTAGNIYTDGPGPWWVVVGERGYVEPGALFGAKLGFAQLEIG